jgi:ATP/maltotriose-dependent transcriptional regulator MalT
LGRDGELAAAAGFLDAVPGHACALVLEGEPGIGKTTLWQEITGRAAGRSYSVLSCRAAQAETKLAFASLTDLLGDVADTVLVQLPDPQRRALETALLRADPLQGTAVDQRAVAAAVVSVLAVLAGDGPVVVAVDDAHWVDTSTARVLEFAARRLGSRPVGLLVSVRTKAGPGLPFGVERAFGDDHLRRLALGPLSLGALRELLRARLGAAPSRPVLLRLAQVCRGNPLFAIELVRALPPGRWLPADLLPVPDSLSRLLAGQIHRLPVDAREALFVASVLAMPRAGLVRQAAGVTPAALAGPERAGVIELAGDVVRFAHPLLASSVASLVPARRRRELHRRLAELAEEPEERARHLALAATEPDPSVAAALEKAADRARARGAPDAAAELLEWAVALTPGRAVAARRRRVMAAAENWFHAGDRSRCRDLLERLLAELPEGTRRAAALRLLAEVRYYHDSFPEALRLLEAAVPQAGDDVRLRAGIELELAFARLNTGDMPGAVPHARAALVGAESAGDQGLLAQALAVAVTTEVALGRGADRASLERALALEGWQAPTVVALRPSYLAGAAALLTGDLDTAHCTLASLRQKLIVRGEDSDLPAVAFHATAAECLRGDTAAAARLAEEAMAISLELESRITRGMALCAKAWADSYRGEAGLARAAAQEALALYQQAGWGWGTAVPLMILGFIEVSVGDFAAADRTLRPLSDMVEAMGLAEPMAAFFLPDEIEALIALGELDRAERLATRLQERGRALDRAWALAAAARCRALLLAARGDLGGALAAVEEAVRQHERLAMPFELARTLLVLGQVRRRWRQKAAARRALDRAQEIFIGTGAPLWAGKAEAEIARLGIRHAPAGLSETEQRVAMLAASGLTNREVAGALFISAKTVEVNLAKVYRKLEIHTRAELGSRMSMTGTPSTEPPASGKHGETPY